MISTTVDFDNILLVHPNEFEIVVDPLSINEYSIVDLENIEFTSMSMDNNHDLAMFDLDFAGDIEFSLIRDEVGNQDFAYYGNPRQVFVSATFKY